MDKISMKKNILWIYNRPLNPEVGGTERITHLISEGLKERGYNTFGILQLFKDSGSIIYQGEEIPDLYTFLQKHQIDIIINQIGYDDWLLKKFLEKGGDKWKKEGGKIITCLHFDPKPTSDYYLFKSQLIKNFQSHINLLKSLLLYPYYKKRQERKLGHIYNFLYDSSDAFVTLSKTHFPYFKKLTKRSEYIKLHAINNPLTFPDISRETDLSSKKKQILVCSRMTEYQKRISIVLKVWKRLYKKEVAKDWELIIVGDGPDLDFYKSFSKKHQLKRIHFEGQQSPEKYYNEASIFLMTSVGIEGWGLTITESLQRGVVPIVMNTASVYSEIINTNYNGILTKKKSLTSFTNAIYYLVTNKTILKQMQLNALNSSNKFRGEIILNKWELLLKDI